jgi:hypothetical protein
MQVAMVAQELHLQLLAPLLFMVVVEAVIHLRDLLLELVVQVAAEMETQDLEVVVMELPTRAAAAAVAVVHQVLQVVQVAQALLSFVTHPFTKTHSQHQYHRHMQMVIPSIHSYHLVL